MKKTTIFFRALESGDCNDIDEKTILDENGNYIRLRTDRERYEENADNGHSKYSKDDEISLEEMHDHIKMHYRHDTNCISFTSNANVVLNYGRVDFYEKYVMIKVPKKEFGQRAKFAGQYMLKEIEKRVNEFIAALDANKEDDAKIIETLDRIDQSSSSNELKALIQTELKALKPVNKTKSMMKQGIKYKAPHSRISSYQALNTEQNLAKNKIMAKLTLLERKTDMDSLVPYITNNKVAESVGNAFSSMEVVHYGDIPGEQITNVSSIIMDMFALLQQIENKDIPNIYDLKKELIDFVNNGTQVSIPDDSVLLRDDKVKDNITIQEMYELTDGKVEFGMADSIIKSMFYLAKSQVRAREISNLLNEITGNNRKYKQAIEYIASNGFRIEPEEITRQSNKGYRISESANLKLKTNEIPLVDAIKNLSSDEQIEILEKGGVSNTRNIITDIFSKIQRDERISREEYYASAIIDLCNWKELGVEELTVEQRNDFLKKLQEKDCVKIYNRLKEAGISENEIATYTINLASKEQFSNILTENNYIELIHQNKEALSQELSIPKIETFLGYFDVEGTGIVLRDYQRNAVEKTDEIFESKRFASVVLPTGAGKTFVALTELIEHKDEPILYLAPQNEILEQTKDRIIEYIHGKQGTIGKTKDEIIAEVFPNITFETYPGLLARRGKDIIKEKYGFIVLDELHRTGAKEWEGKLDEILENQNEDTKVLGITATPTRDIDDRNMADETALKLGYTEKEIQKREHIAMDMDLVDAIKLGLVVNPKIISCEYNLKTDGSMENLLEKINSIEDEEIRKEKIQQYETLRRNIDKSKGIPEILKHNIKPGGKYIVFIPITENGEMIEDEDGNEIGKKTGVDKIQEYDQKIREYMKDSGMSVKSYSMLGAYSNKENENQLESFENDNSEDVKFMIVMNKANEGLHIDGIDGIVWFRALDENSRILYLQQLGRAIYSENPNNPTPDEKRPVIIDLANNTMRVDIDKEIKNNTKRDDLELLSLVVDWVKLHDGLPNIDSTNKIEQRYAATLYRIQNEYMKYISGFDEFTDLDEQKKEQIQEILNKGAEIDLWDIELQPKIILKANKILEVNEFEVTGEMRDFVNIENEVNAIVNKSSSLKNALEIEEWCKEIFKDKKIWERRLPSRIAKEEYEKRLGKRLSTIRTKIKKYEGKEIEEIENEEDRQIVEIIRRLDIEYGLGDLLKNTLEIEEWCKEKYGEKKIWERRLTNSEAKEEYEKRLGQRLSTIRKKIKKYEGKEIEEIENGEDRQIVEIIRRLDIEYGLGGSLKNALEIEEWCKEKYGNNKKWERRLPSKGAKEEYEKKLVIRLFNIRKKIKKYEGKEIEEIENEEDRQIVEIIRRLDIEYGLGDLLKNTLEIEEWCKENFKDKKIWERRLPNSEAKEEYEKRLGKRLSTIRTKIKKYEGKEIEEIENEEDRQIVEIIRRLDIEYGLGDSLKNTLEIEEWCKEKYGEKKIWERRLPNQKADDNYEKRLGHRLSTIRTKIKKYEGKEIEEIENEENRQIVEIIRRLDIEYGLGKLLKNTLEIEEWCKEKYGDKKIWERRLPRSEAKEEYEKRLGQRLSTIRKKIKKYEGKEIEEIENEEDRQIVEIIRRLDREYNYREYKGKDIGAIGFETGITNVELCDEEDKALQQLVEQTKEGGIKLDEQS